MFKFTLVLEDGTPADPPTFTAAAPNWKAGDTIPLGGGERYRVIDVQAAPDGERNTGRREGIAGRSRRRSPQ